MNPRVWKWQFWQQIVLSLVLGVAAGALINNFGGGEKTAADWLAHGDAIRTAHPVERVRLLSWPDLERRPVETPNIRCAYWRLPGSSYEEPCGFDRPDHGIYARLLAQRWPGVAFGMKSG